MTSEPPAELVALAELSGRLGADPLQIQGPGGNTSLKSGGAMWIKASGTALAEATRRDVFVAVDRERACAEIDGARRGEGDGTCRAALLDPEAGLRPSIETTFHALLDAPVVLHTHSVATLAHVTSDEGARVAVEALAALDAGRGAALVPYARPGLELTRAIAAHHAGQRILLLRNHGLIVAGDDVGDAASRLEEVERRLALEPRREVTIDDLWDDAEVSAIARAGSYWPDHVVFLGPGLPERRAREGNAALMLRCLADVIARVPSAWRMRPIGPDAEAALMDWDAEHYRQKLARGKR